MLWSTHCSNAPPRNGKEPPMPAKAPPLTADQFDVVGTIDDAGLKVLADLLVTLYMENESGTDFDEPRENRGAA
jgi:hypothetical protein